MFNSSHVYGTPSYWMQRFFTVSSGSTVLDTTLKASNYSALVASAISWKSFESNENYIRIKVLFLKLAYLEFIYFMLIIYALSLTTH